LGEWPAFRVVIGVFWPVFQCFFFGFFMPDLRTSADFY
jgi:hypothetical protein